jgi:3',5'-cyclic AMP phosphodiesterase CpdA
MTRVVVLSDIHLSPTHGFFWDNWCVAREFADTADADAVVVNGDLAINGPESDAELAFALFLHKPLFLEHPGDDEVSASCMVPSARARLLDRLNRSNVRLIVSGHLHQHRDRMVGDLRHLWVPAVAFAAPRALGGDARCGVTVLEFAQDNVEVTVAQPRGLISHDLAAIKGHGRYEFLRDMPPCPPAEAD